LFGSQFFRAKRAFVFIAPCHHAFLHLKNPGSPVLLAPPVPAN
jgi:hypothetical protein